MGVGGIAQGKEEETAAEQRLSKMPRTLLKGEHVSLRVLYVRLHRELED